MGFSPLKTVKIVETRGLKPLVYAEKRKSYVVNKKSIYVIQQEKLPLAVNPLTSLARALGIHPNEGRMLLLLFGQAFFLGIMMTTFYSVSNALFINEFGADAYPYAYIATAVTMIGIGTMFAQMERRLRFETFLAGSLGFLFVSLMVLWIGVRVSSASWLIFIVMVWMRQLWVSGNLILWALAGRLFNVQQGKRLFSLVMVGSVLAFIIAGLSTPLLIGAVGVENLLLISGLSILPALALQWMTVREFHNSIHHPAHIYEVQDEASRSKLNLASIRVLLRSRYVVLIFTITFLAVLIGYLLYFAMATEASIKFEDSEALGSFFGNYLGFSTLLLLVLAGISGRFFERFGINFGIFTNPILVFSGVLILAFTATFLDAPAALFWMVVGTKLVDDAAVILTISGRNLLYQPLPTDRRITVQTVTESIIDSLASATAGCLLLVFRAVSGFELTHLYYVLLVLVGLRLMNGVWLSRAYRVAIREALLRRHFGRDSTAVPIDNISVSVLQEELKSSHPGVVLYGMETLIQQAPERLDAQLPDLLKHPEPEVRQKALQYIGQAQQSSLLSQVLARLQAEELPTVRAEVLRTLAALGEIDAVLDYAADANFQVRSGAIVGLLRYGGLTAILAVGQKLLAMQKDVNPRERILAAQIVGEISDNRFYHPLLELLQDADLDVQRAAIKAAAQVNAPALWNPILAKLDYPAFASIAMSTLAKGGESVVPLLGRAFKEDTEPYIRIQLARAMGRIRGSQAIEVLASEIQYPDEIVRTEILSALSRCAYQAPAREIPAIKQQIRQEASAAAWLLGTFLDLRNSKLGAVPEIRFLQHILLEHLQRGKDRLLYLLTFLHDPESLRKAYLILRSEEVTPEEHAFAVELLETTLEPEFKNYLMTLWQNDTPDNQLAALEAAFPQPTLNVIERIGLMLEEEERLNNWGRACTMFVVSKLRLPAFEDFSTAPESAQRALERETRRWDVSRLQPEHADRQIGSSRELSMLSTMERVLFLKGIDLFSRIPSDDLVWVAHIAKEVRIPAGEMFIHAGDVGDSLYVIMEGAARVTIENEQEVANVGSNGIIGEMSVFTNRRRSANVTATEDILALKIERQYLQEHIADHPELAIGIIELLAERLVVANRPLANT